MSLIIQLALVLTSFSFGETLISTGEIFDKEGKEKKFTYERYQTTEGNKISDRAVYKDLQGEVLTEEKMERVDGKLVRYEMEQKQIRQKAWIDVSKDEITFNLKKYRKRNYPQSIKKPGNFIVGLQIVPTIHENWADFLKGDDMDVKLGVWHRQEAIKFNLSRDKMDDNQMVIKMNPSSMFIRAVVDPIYFTFDRKTKNLISYKGRTTPKEKRGRNFYDFDGLTTYKTMKAAPSKSKAKSKAKKG